MMTAVNKPTDKVGFEPVLLENFYSQDMMDLIRMQIDELKKRPCASIDTEMFFRKQFHNEALFIALSMLMVPRLELLLGRKIKPSYNFASCYDEGKGKCPRHTDRPQCKYTVDLCVSQRKPWEFNAVGEDGAERSFFMEPGDAILLSGTHHEHWRPDLQADNFCDLVFFHFVDHDYEGDLS